MKSFDEWNAWEFSRSEEKLSDRDEAIIRRWMAAKQLDMLADIARDLHKGEYLTCDTLREVREYATKLAAGKRAEIIREWEIARASEVE